MVLNGGNIWLLLQELLMLDNSLKGPLMTLPTFRPQARQDFKAFVLHNRGVSHYDISQYLNITQLQAVASVARELAYANSPK
jgi:hypothetical protein